MRWPATISKTPQTTDTISALSQTDRHARLSRRAKIKPNPARTNINPQRGRSPGGTLNEKTTKKSGNRVNPEQDPQQGLSIDADLVHRCAANVRDEARRTRSAEHETKTESRRRLQHAGYAWSLARRSDHFRYFPKRCAEIQTKPEMKAPTKPVPGRMPDHRGSSG
jgi:hypothetical protein